MLHGFGIWVVSALLHSFFYVGWFIITGSREMMPLLYATIVLSFLLSIPPVLIVWFIYAVAIYQQYFGQPLFRLLLRVVIVLALVCGFLVSWVIGRGGHFFMPSICTMLLPLLTAVIALYIHRSRIIRNGTEPVIIKQ